MLQTCMGCGHTVDTDDQDIGCEEWWTEEGDSGTDYYHGDCWNRMMEKREEQAVGATHLELEELVDENDAPWALYAEGHHPPADLIRAIQQWESENEVLEHAYLELEVKQAFFYRQHVGMPDEAVYAYRECAQDYPGAFAVTVLYL